MKCKCKNCKYYHCEDKKCYINIDDLRDIGGYVPSCAIPVNVNPDDYCSYFELRRKNNEL